MAIKYVCDICNKESERTHQITRLEIKPGKITKFDIKTSIKFYAPSEDWIDWAFDRKIMHACSRACFNNWEKTVNGKGRIMTEKYMVLRLLIDTKKKTVKLGEIEKNPISKQQAKSLFEKLTEYTRFWGRNERMIEFAAKSIVHDNEIFVRLSDITKERTIDKQINIDEL